MILGILFFPLLQDFDLIFLNNSSYNRLDFGLRVFVFGPRRTLLFGVAPFNIVRGGGGGCDYLDLGAFGLGSGGRRLFFFRFCHFHSEGASPSTSAATTRSKCRRPVMLLILMIAMLSPIPAAIPAEGFPSIGTPASVAASPSPLH